MDFKPARTLFRQARRKSLAADEVGQRRIAGRAELGKIRPQTKAATARTQNHAPDGIIQQGKLEGFVQVVPCPAIDRAAIRRIQQDIENRIAAPGDNPQDPMAGIGSLPQPFQVLAACLQHAIGQRFRLKRGLGLHSGKDTQQARGYRCGPGIGQDATHHPLGGLSGCNDAIKTRANGVIRITYADNGKWREMDEPRIMSIVRPEKFDQTDRPWRRGLQPAKLRYRNLPLRQIHRRDLMARPFITTTAEASQFRSRRTRTDCPNKNRGVFIFC